MAQIQLGGAILEFLCNHIRSISYCHGPRDGVKFSSLVNGRGFSTLQGGGVELWKANAMLAWSLCAEGAYLHVVSIVCHMNEWS